jgi:chemotaxis receptor (MCP) glutamine deamidase CheD
MTAALEVLGTCLAGCDPDTKLKVQMTGMVGSLLDMLNQGLRTKNDQIEYAMFALWKLVTDSKEASEELSSSAFHSDLVPMIMQDYQ